MAHKTNHRKTLEAHQKEQAKLRSEVVAELQKGVTLKPYAGRPRDKDGR